MAYALTTEQVQQVVQNTVLVILARPDLLPDEWRADVARAADETALARVVADYVAGMTDRFALQEHARLTGG